VSLKHDLDHFSNIAAVFNGRPEPGIAVRALCIAYCVVHMRQSGIHNGGIKVNFVADMLEEVRLSTWLVSGALLLLSTAMIVCATVSGARRAMAARLAAAVDLTVDESARRSIETAQSRRLIGAAAGGAVGAIAATWFVFFVGADRGGPAPLFLIGAYAVGAAVGRAVASATGEVAKPIVGVQMANARHRELRDYIPRWERIVTRTTVGVSLAALALEMTLPLLATRTTGRVFPEAPSVAALITMFAILALTGFEVVGRLVVRAHQIQGSATGLAWDDVLRSAAVRDLAAGAFLLATFGTFFGIQEIVGALSHLGQPFIPTVVGFNLVGGIAVVAAAIEVSLPRPRRHILRRRYPELVKIGAQ
jgi:hypothetical protein